MRFVVEITVHFGERAGFFSERFGLERAHAKPGCGGLGQGVAMKRFDVGSRVVEPTYGLGSVVAVEDNYTRVQFDEHGIKKFLTSLSRLEPSSEPAPAGLKAKGRK